MPQKENFFYNKTYTIIKIVTHSTKTIQPSQKTTISNVATISNVTIISKTLNNKNTLLTTFSSFINTNKHITSHYQHLPYVEMPARNYLAAKT